MPLQKLSISVCRFVAAISILALAACSADTIFEPPIPVDPLVPAPALRPIIFSSWRDATFGINNLEVIAMKADGTDMVNLTRNARNDTDASWSPNGQQIAFASDRDGGYDIYVMNSDGSGVRRITHDPLDDRRPTWAPDGRKIAFESGRDGHLPSAFSGVRYNDVYIMDADGSHVVNITQTPATTEGWVSWAPDGKTIAFSKSGVGIVLANPDGSNQRPLHAPIAQFVDDVAGWSPDGSRIAFSAFNNDHPFATATWVIFTIRPDGTDLQRLTGLGFSSARFPAWSPDGQRIVYNRDALDESWGRFNTQNLWVMNADGSSSVKLTTDPNKKNELGGPQAWTK